MKRLFLILAVASISILSMGVNSRDAAERREYVTVNSGGSGYFTNPISVAKIQRNRRDVSQIYFSIRGTGVMVVTVQYRSPGDSEWTVYNTYTTITHQTIAVVAAGVSWRAGVLADDYISGEYVFGFDW